MRTTSSSVRCLRQRLEQHRRFWARGHQAVPPASFRVGDFFFSRHFEAARPLLARNRLIKPDDLDVSAYLPDYERMFDDAEAVDQDGFWTAEPFTGIPWMEGILGCEIRANEESFSSRPLPGGIAEADRVGLDPANPWLAKYLEYTRALVAASGGRFPVGQPIMRGPTDMVGALVGQSEMIFALEDEPEAMRRLIGAVTESFLRVIEEQKRLTPDFHGGEALGFYHVWTPGTAIWFQDDLSAVLSPAMYRDFFLDAGRRICRGYRYTAIHLHPSSFFILDDLFTIDGLRAVEVNKDVGGPSVKEMLPVLARIVEKKNLILWGDLSIDDLELVHKGLPSGGLCLHIVVPTLEEAKARHAYIQRWE